MKRNLVLALSILFIVLLCTPYLLGSAQALENRPFLIASSDTESDDNEYQFYEEEGKDAAAWYENEGSDVNPVEEDDQEIYVPDEESADEQEASEDDA